MSETAEQIAVKGREELAKVLDLMGLKHVITIEAVAPDEGVHHFYLNYRIWMAGLRHDNKVQVSGENVSRVFDMRMPLFKRLLGDIGLGLLEHTRKEDQLEDDD